MTGTTPLLELRAVSKVYGGGFLKKREAVVALDGLSFTLGDERPSITAIAGESGSGKTTLAHLLLGHISPTSGQVLYRGQDVTTMGTRERLQFRREVQPIFQDPFAAFNPFYRVRHAFDIVTRNFDIADAPRAVAQAIDLVGLDPARVLAAFPHELSGGERQRLMIARAFMPRPLLIVADEPVSMVDATIRLEILAILRRLREQEGVSFLYVTHDLSTAHHFADELLVLREGQIVERGAAREVIDSPRHPYTRALVGAVPVLDPDVRWGAA
jgi:peptide/nickel transport system ATP-binding protein